MDDRFMRRDRDPLIKMPELPFAGPISAPITGMTGIPRMAPGKAVGTPQIIAPVTTVIDKSRELGIGDRRLCDGERRDYDLIGPFFVVEPEGGIAGCAQHECPTRHINKTWAGSSGALRGNIGAKRQFRRRVGQRLTRPQESFRVHVFMENAELMEKTSFGINNISIKTTDHRIKDILHVTKNIRHR
jgi:hypothetical protein